MKKNKRDFCFTECIIIIIFTLIMILNFELVVNAEELTPIIPTNNFEYSSADDMLDFLSNLPDNPYRFYGCQTLVVLVSQDQYFYRMDVYLTPLPTQNGDFLGTPLSAQVDGNYIDLLSGTYTLSYRINYDKEDNELRVSSVSIPLHYIDNDMQVLFLNERDVYYQNTENVAIKALEQSGPDFPDGDYTGHSVKPPFYDDENTPSIPDTETLSDNNLLKRIANGILDLGNKVKNGFNNIYDNIKDFTQPYYEEFLKLYNAIRGGIDYIKQPIDLDAVKTKINNLTIMQDINTITIDVNTLKNLFNGASPKTDSNAQFVIDFTPVEMFNTGPVVVDFTFYASIRSICNAFILMSVILSFILYILKALPDIIRGASADDK